MSYAQRGIGLTLACLVAGLVGCSSNMSKEDMQKMQPQRPAELDHLAAFVGDWKGEMVMEMAGAEEPCTVQCTSHYSWDCDKWVLIEKSECTGGEMGDMKGIAAWTYDIKAKKFRTFWMGNSAMMMRGTATYCPESRVWKMKSLSHTPWGNSTGVGTMTMTSDDTVAWEWKETVFFGLIKVMEGHGAMHRQ